MNPRRARGRRRAVRMARAAGLLLALLTAVLPLGGRGEAAPPAPSWAVDRPAAGTPAPSDVVRAYLPQPADAAAGPELPAPPSIPPAATLDRPHPAPAIVDDLPLLPPPRAARGGADRAAPPDEDRDLLLGAARNAVKQQNWSHAIARFQEFFKRYGDDPEVRKEYAGVLVQAGRLAEALAEYRRLAAARPSDRDVLIGLADAAVQSKDYPAAVTALVRALALAPDDREAAVKLARAYVFADQFAYALQVYDRYLSAILPSDEHAPRGMGALLIDLGRPAEAVPYLTARLEAQPADADALATLVQAYARMGDMDQARKTLDALAERAPRALGVRQELGDSLYAADILDLAAEVYGQILRAEPANGFALLGVARVRMKQFEPAQALQTLNQVPKDPAYARSGTLALAEYHQLVGEYLEAKEIYQGFLRCNERDDEARLSLAQLLAFIREDEKAKAEYLKIPCTAQQTRAARVGVVAVLTTQRHFADAIEQGRRLLAEKPDDGAAMAQLVLTLGKAGQPDEAVAQARRFLRDFTRNAPACLTVRFALAHVLRDARRFQEAAHEYEALLALPDGRTPEATYGLARAFEGMGDPDKARRIIGEYTAGAPTDARIRLRLADQCSADFSDGPVVELADAVLKFDPDNLAALIRLADARGRLDRQTGRVADAVDAAHAVLAQSPTNVRGRLALARALATGQQFPASVSAYQPLIAADPDFLVPRREQARVLYSDHQYGAGAMAYLDMVRPCADDRLHADVAALAERDPRAAAVLGPCLAAGLPGDVLVAEASKAAAALGDADTGAALQRLLLDYKARRTEQEGSRLEGEFKEDFWRHYAVIPVARNLIALEPSNTSALFDLGQDFSTIRQTRNAVAAYSDDIAIDPTEHEAQTALERASLEMRPQATGMIDYFQQKGFDGLAHIERTFYRTWARLPFGDEDEYVSLGFARANLVPKDDRPLDGNIYSFGWQQKFLCDGRLLLSALANVEQFPDRLTTRPTFDAGARYVFCDEVTGRVGAFLENVEENGESLCQDIYRYGARLGADVQPYRIWTVAGTGTIYGYSDDNDALEFYLKNDVVLLPPPCQLKVVVVTDMLGYREHTVFPTADPDFLFGTLHPYFSPSFYGYYEARVEWKHWLSRDYFAHSNQCWYSLQYGLGWDNSFNNYNTFRVQGNWDVRPWLTVGADAQAILSPVYKEAQATGFVTVRFP